MKNVQSAVQEERNRRFQPLDTALATGKLQKKQPVEKQEAKKELVQEKAVSRKKQKKSLQPASTATNG